MRLSARSLPRRQLDAALPTAGCIGKPHRRKTAPPCEGVFVCVCVCVCTRARELAEHRERERESITARTSPRKIGELSARRTHCGDAAPAAATRFPKRLGSSAASERPPDPLR